MSGNSHQRRTLRRAQDDSRPWGKAVVRERRKAKRLKAGFPNIARMVRDGEATILD